MQWRVLQSGTVAARGYFIAKDGGDADHVEVVPLGVKLEGRQMQPAGADVQLDWTVNGVPYRYCVRHKTV